MSRYIDADELKKRMLSVFEDDGIGVVLNGYWSSKLVREIIDEQPTADVVEVVHGEWIAEEIHNCWTEFECSVCKFKHKSVHNFGRPMTEFNYCPNCGADMRGGHNECE